MTTAFPQSSVTTKIWKRALFQQNTKHFGQAKDSPFARPPFSNIIPLFSSHTKALAKLLSGNTSDFSLFQVQYPVIDDLLCQLQLLPTTSAVTSTLSNDELITDMKVVQKGKRPQCQGDITAYIRLPLHSLLLLILWYPLSTIVSKIPIYYNAGKRFYKLCSAKSLGIIT